MTTKRAERRGRWTAEQERQVGREIRSAEVRALTAVRGLPAADAILGTRPRRLERTRAGEVGRLEAAIAAVWAAAVGDPVMRDRARVARKSWEEAESLRLHVDGDEVLPQRADAFVGGDRREGEAWVGERDADIESGRFLDFGEVVVEQLLVGTQSRKKEVLHPHVVGAPDLR